MQLYSNKLLSWPQVIHAFQGARLYPGRWQNYYFYRVSRIQPLIITTHSPLDFLQENNQYYCYDKLNRDKNLEEFENIRESVTLQNQEMDYNETWIYVPKFVAAEDIIVVHNDLARDIHQLLLNITINPHFLQLLKIHKYLRPTLILNERCRRLCGLFK